MTRSTKTICVCVLTMLAFVAQLDAADARSGTLTCVGLYSETDAGSVSYRVGTGPWTVIQVGDVIPAKAEIRVNVDRDWIELIQSNNPNAVYGIMGSESGEVVKKVADIIRSTPRNVTFPKKSAKDDPAFKDKLVVVRYLGRQRYKKDASDPIVDIRYGDVLELAGTVNIIAINNTLTLMYPNGEVTTVVGPIRFDIAKMFTNESLYKYLNVAK